LNIAVLVIQVLGTTLTNQNDIHDEVNSILISGNACCPSVQNLFVFPFHKKIQIKIYKTAILPILLYGCETWSPTFREEHGPKREDEGTWRKLHNDELHSLYSSLNNVRVIK
jgi:hypothetical protein